MLVLRGCIGEKSLTAFHRLRVVGSRRIYENFLPTDNSFFADSEYVLLSPDNPKQFFSAGTSDQTLTLVINPEEYGKEILQRIDGLIALWFLKSLAKDPRAPRLEAHELSKFSSSVMAARRVFVESVDFSQVSMTVVSDSYSQDYLAAKRIDSQLSPPPVGVRLRQEARVRNIEPSFHLWTEPSAYSERFVGSLREKLDQRQPAGCDFNPDEKWGHIVSIPAGLFEGFPYEVAWAVSHGYCLITGAFLPRWGLEPGIDFIEVSTPEELERVVTYLSRNPQLTKLMRWRAQAKAAVFSASNVYRNLVWP